MLNPKIPSWASGAGLAPVARQLVALAGIGREGTSGWIREATQKLVSRTPITPGTPVCTEALQSLTEEAGGYQ